MKKTEKVQGKKLEELQDQVIEALENALGEIRQYKAANDTFFYCAIENCLMFMDEAEGYLENLQDELGKEIEEGLK